MLVKPSHDWAPWWHWEQSDGQDTWPCTHRVHGTAQTWESAHIVTAHERNQRWGRSWMCSPLMVSPHSRHWQGGSPPGQQNKGPQLLATVFCKVSRENLLCQKTQGEELHRAEIRKCWRFLHQEYMSFLKVFLKNTKATGRQIIFY